jgi:hypothetical protein
VEVVGHRAAWKHYIRGNVVSETSVTLITNFLNACSAMAKHKEADDEQDDGEAEATVPKPLQFSTTTLSVQQVRGIVSEMASAHPGQKKEEGLQTSKTLSTSLKIGTSMWSDLPESGPGAIDSSGGRTDATPYVQERPSLQQPDSADGNAPGSSGTRTRGAPGAVSLYAKLQPARWQCWKKAVFSRPLVPTVDQWIVIESVHERLVHEKTEGLKDRQKTTKTEPLREMIQGLPGAGKTMVITLLIEFFVVVLGWSHGVEFACIASMNTMVALIGGSTIHSFGEVPIGDEQASLRTKTKLGQARCEHHVHEM